MRAPERRRAQGQDRSSLPLNGSQNGETLDDLLPEAFAAVPRSRPAATENMRHFDVQIVGGAVLHRGMIAEMVTGEGKTLVATLPAYLNALTGKGVHIVTVNDYLARRDCEWMSPIYLALGDTARGYIQSDRRTPSRARRKAYDCDVTYAAHSTASTASTICATTWKPAR